LGVGEGSQPYTLAEGAWFDERTQQESEFKCYIWIVTGSLADEWEKETKTDNRGCEALLQMNPR